MKKLDPEKDIIRGATVHVDSTGVPFVYLDEHQAALKKWCSYAWSDGYDAGWADCRMGPDTRDNPYGPKQQRNALCAHGAVKNREYCAHCDAGLPFSLVTGETDEK